MEMNISATSGRTGSFRKWLQEHVPSSNDDDIPGGATPIAIGEPPSDRNALADLPNRPWDIPGVGKSF
jgi:hypothetical protein